MIFRKFAIFPTIARDFCRKMTDASPAPNLRPVVYVLYYSMYGHIAKMAEHVAAGAKAAGGDVHIFQVPETLPAQVLEKMHAPPKKDHPILDVQYVYTSQCTTAMTIFTHMCCRVFVKQTE